MCDNVLIRADNLVILYVFVKFLQIEQIIGNNFPISEDGEDVVEGNISLCHNSFLNDWILNLNRH